MKPDYISWGTLRSRQEAELAFGKEVVFGLVFGVVGNYRIINFNFYEKIL